MFLHSIMQLQQNCPIQSSHEQYAVQSFALQLNCTHHILYGGLERQNNSTLSYSNS